MLPCYSEYRVAGITLKAPADLSQQTRLVTPRRKEGLCVLGSGGEAGRHPVVLVKGALVQGEGGEGNKPALKFGFHLRQRAPLNCTRPLRTDTAGASWESLAGCTAREPPRCQSRAWCPVVPHQIQVRERCQGQGAARSASASAQAAVGEHLSGLRGWQHRWVTSLCSRKHPTPQGFISHPQEGGSTCCHSAIPVLPVAWKGVRGQELPVNYSVLFFPFWN